MEATLMPPANTSALVEPTIVAPVVTTAVVIPPELISKYGNGNLSKFHHYLFDLESPEHFITWNFNYIISSCLSRKVWLGNDFKVYPNLYVIFVGPPACGKSLPASKTTEILQNLVDLKVDGDKIFERRLVNISPDSVTLEALYEGLAGASEGVKICDKPVVIYTHASMSFCIGEEMGTLFRENQNDLVTFLTQGWDCRDFHRKTKSCGEVNIKNMCINFLGCCTPDWLSDNVNAKLINQGFTSRVIFLFGEKPRKRTTILRVNADQRASLKSIIGHLKRISKLCGELQHSPESYAWYDNWVQKQMDNQVNKDKKLAHYYGRKRVHLLKCAMIAHFSDKETMVLDVEDFERGLAMLEIAEMDMHRALMSTGRNPISVLANNIMTDLKKNPKGKALKKIIVDFFDGGNEEEISQALTFLQTTGQAITYNNGGENGGTFYKSSSEDVEVTPE